MIAFELTTPLKDIISAYSTLCFTPVQFHGNYFHQVCISHFCLFFVKRDYICIYSRTILSLVCFGAL